jgi:hypothetical protein
MLDKRASLPGFGSTIAEAFKSPLPRIFLFSFLIAWRLLKCHATEQRASLHIHLEPGSL